MKKCCRCKKKKPKADFNKDKSRNDGLHAYCRVCMSEYLAEHKAEKLKKFKAEVDLTCVVCGAHSAEDYHFHHIDPSTKTKDKSRPAGRKRAVADMLHSNHS